MKKPIFAGYINLKPINGIIFHLTPKINLTKNTSLVNLMESFSCRQMKTHMGENIVLVP